jgi:hypothetical protein
MRTVTNEESGKPLYNVNVTLIESLETVLTVESGKYKLSTKYACAGTIAFAREGYKTQTFTIDIAEGGAITQDVKLVAV